MQAMTELDEKLKEVNGSIRELQTEIDKMQTIYQEMRTLEQKKLFIERAIDSLRALSQMDEKVQMLGEDAPKDVWGVAEQLNG